MLLQSKGSGALWKLGAITCDDYSEWREQGDRLLASMLCSSGVDSQQLRYHAHKDG